MLKNPLYLTSLHLAGYKSIRDAKIEFLEGLNIVIGKNGGGKTNLLEFVNAIINNKYIYNADFDFETFSTLFFVRTRQNELKVTKNNDNIIAIGFNQDIYTINTENRAFFSPPTKLIAATLSYQKRLIVFNRPNKKINLLDNPLKLTINNEKHSLFPNNSIRYSEKNLSSSFLILKSFLSFFERKIETLNKSEEIKVLLPNCFIEFIANENLLTNLQKYSPIEDLRISPNINVYEQGFGNTEISVQNIYIEFLLNNRWHSWEMLSDGTKRLFYLITEVTLSNGIVLLEEPELGVHPHQLHQIMQFLKEQAETKQIILTTHSPQVLDVLNVDELDRIIVADITKEKGSQFRHLDEKTVAKAKHYLENDGFISDFWRYSTLEPREIL
jgi:predicted ATP-dependent endonuclease of OLD family